MVSSEILGQTSQIIHALDKQWILPMSPKGFLCYFKSDKLRLFEFWLSAKFWHFTAFGSSVIYFYLHDTACGDWSEHNQLSGEQY